MSAGIDTDHGQADECSARGGVHGMILVMMSALGAGLILVTSSETMIAANFRNSREALHAADAAAERAIGDVAAVGDWDQLLNGTRSVDVRRRARPAGTRTLNGWPMSTCPSSSRSRAVTRRRRAAVPRWMPSRPIGRGARTTRGGSSTRTVELKNVVPNGAVDSPYYVVVLVGDDPSETDNDPSHDGAGPGNPGAGVLALRAEVFGPRAAHKVVELTSARTTRGGTLCCRGAQCGNSLTSFLASFASIEEQTDIGH